MTLSFPNTEHMRAALDCRQEYFDFGESRIHGSGGFHQKVYDDFGRWLSDIEDFKNDSYDNSEVLVPATTFFSLENNKILGTIQIRHRLNNYLLKTGGHIGYSIRPTERRKGYGTQMLFLALNECRKMGMGRVLITCDKDNIASAKTARSNAGKLESELIDNKGNIIIQRYWITL